MQSKYEQAVSQLYGLGHELAGTPSHKFELDKMRVLLGALGNPERSFRPVLIAGTNGKGSTAATLESIVRAAGHRTGLYTSPHLVKVNERIRVGGVSIGDAEFAGVHEKVEAAAQRLMAGGELPWHPSFFEIMTAMAFEHFRDAGVEIAVLEVGMGGRLDATNVVEPLISIITDVALDHQQYLGNTVAEIAGEKAGIIHEGGVVVTLPQHPEANDVIGNAILRRNARGVSAAAYVPPITPGAEAQNEAESAKSGRTGYRMTVMEQEIRVDSPLAGRHQLRNVALAIAASVELNALGVEVKPGAIEKGVRETNWPGRFQVVNKGGLEVVFDVAHNPAGAWALRSSLSRWFEDRPLILVFGAMRDKAFGEMAGILFPIAGTVLATQAENPRSATPAEIVQAGARTGALIECLPTVAAAMERARKLAEPGAVVVVTGSIFVVGEAMQTLGVRVAAGEPL
jgi:dihydrofolate synthase/folylpolyglutamate synthase